MSDNPPIEWHTTAGQRLVQEWSANDGYIIDETVRTLWAQERLRGMTGDQAVNTWLTEQAIKAKLSTSSYVFTMPAYEQWARTYAEKWNALVCGECDTETTLLNAIDLWDERRNDAPEAVALEEFNEVFGQEERARYKKLNDDRAWKPPVA